MDKTTWILLSAGVVVTAFNIWWLRRRLGIDVIKEFRRDIKQPQAIRTPYLVVLSVVLIGWTLLSLAWFTASPENVVFLAIFLGLSILSARAMFKRWRALAS